MWLVIDDGNILAPYADRYRLFEDFVDAGKWAQERGYEDPFRMGVNAKEGMLTTYRCGEVNVSMINLSVKRSSPTTKATPEAP